MTCARRTVNTCLSALRLLTHHDPQKWGGGVTNSQWAGARPPLTPPTEHVLQEAGPA